MIGLFISKTNINNSINGYRKNYHKICFIGIYIYENNLKTYHYNGINKAYFRLNFNNAILYNMYLNDDKQLIFIIF